MSVKVGINGFGRVGRQVLKAINERSKGQLEVVAINYLFDTATHAHLFKYDTNYGRYKGKVAIRGDNLVVDDKEIKVYREEDITNIPWHEQGVDLVIESSGVYRDKLPNPAKGKAGVNAHIEKGGAKKVIITAPGKNEDITIVLGVNEDRYDPHHHHVISNASCTTNCLAPTVKVVNDLLGIEKGYMTTVHAYTNDQRVLDRSHSDLRRARAAGTNIIPTSSGAAKALSLVIPELAGKFDGVSLRVPVTTVSLVDFVATVRNPTTAEELNQAFKEASEGRLKNILGYETEPLVSCDFKGDDRSCVVDAALTMAQDNLVKVFSWYDNEWSYSCRVVDLAMYVANSL